MSEKDVDITEIEEQLVGISNFYGKKTADQIRRIITNLVEKQVEVERLQGFCDKLTLYHEIEKQRFQVEITEKEEDLSQAVKALTEIADTKKDMSGVLARVTARKTLKSIKRSKSE
jgi:hypothetical protein